MAFIIAVDGPAASGKGTVASRLAQAYGYPMLDTGLLYRAVGLRLLNADGDLDDAIAAEAAARGLDLAELEMPQVRTRQAGEAASRVAVHPGVRAALFDLQRDFALREPGSVIDGRDIGTVIAPEARPSCSSRPAPRCAPTAAGSSWSARAKASPSRRSWPISASATSATAAGPARR